MRVSSHSPIEMLVRNFWVAIIATLIKSRSGDGRSPIAHGRSSIARSNVGRRDRRSVQRDVGLWNILLSSLRNGASGDWERRVFRIFLIFSISWLKRQLGWPSLPIGQEVTALLPWAIDDCSRATEGCSLVLIRDNFIIPINGQWNCSDNVDIDKIDQRSNPIAPPLRDLKKSEQLRCSVMINRPISWTPEQLRTIQSNKIALW